MSPAHQPFLSFVIIFFCNFQFYSLSVCIHISLLEFVNFFYSCDFYLLCFLIDASILHCHCWALLGLIFGQSRAFISCMPLCVHARGLSSSSVSYSAPLCMFHNAADTAQPESESTWIWKIRCFNLRLNIKLTKPFCASTHLLDSFEFPLNLFFHFMCVCHGERPFHSFVLWLSVYL